MLSPRIIPALALVAALAHAQELPDVINGCDVVDCPIADNSSITSNCTVQGVSFAGIGLARLPASSDSKLSRLSWVQGVEVDGGIQGKPDDMPKDRRPARTQFFLGTPQDMRWDGVGACAVFFGNVSGSVSFGGRDTTAKGTEGGTCQEAMSEECVSALNRRASRLNYSNLSGDEACQSLRAEFEDNLDEACGRFANGTSWSGLTVKPLTGQNASQPITPQKNETSNCWPITPKSDDLTLLLDHNETGSYYVGFLSDVFHSVTPILTVFYPTQSNNNSLLTETESHMTCLKTIDRNSATERTNHNGGSDEDNGAVGLVSANSFLLASLGAYILFCIL